jgi:hypothetical protein
MPMEKIKESLAKADDAEPRMTDAELILVDAHINEAYDADFKCQNDKCPLPRDCELLLAEVKALREERDAARRKADAWQAKAVDADRRAIRTPVGFGRGGAR